MTHKPYPKYKDSGVEWIGDVPEGWDVLQGSILMKVNSGKPPEEEIHSEQLNERQIPVIGGNGRMGFGSKYNIDFATLSIGRVGALCGNVHYINEKSWITDNSLFITKYNDQLINLLYLKHALQMIRLNEYSTSTAQPLITSETVRRRDIPIPGYKDQVSIVSFISKKESQINSLIKFKTEMINKLEEKRQAVITETVTKGLDSNVPMKDSGVEWIGKVPAHWEVMKLKRLVKQYAEKSKVKGKADYLGLEHIESRTGRIIQWGNSIEQESENLSFKEDDVLYGKLRPYLTKCVIAPRNGCGTSELLVLTPLALISKFLNGLMLTPSFTDHINSSTYGAKMPRANWEFIKNVKVPVPSKNEQVMIVNRIEEAKKSIFELVEIIQNQIDGLKEYRESLIYEAVTGKIDLRDYKGGVSDGD